MTLDLNPLRKTQFPIPELLDAVESILAERHNLTAERDELRREIDRLEAENALLRNHLSPKEEG